jgi:hypothetical protein
MQNAFRTAFTVRRWRLLNTSCSALIAVATLTAPALAQDNTVTYWGGLIFSEEANQLLQDAAKGVRRRDRRQRRCGS